VSTNIRINKICDFCGNEFVAKTLVTRYCSHECNRTHYKKIAKEKKLNQYFEKTEKAKAEPLALDSIKEKDFLSIQETATYLGVSKRTIERIIANGSLHVFRANRRVLVSKLSIEELIRQ